MQQKKILRYGIPILGLVGLAGMLFPLYRAGQTGYSLQEVIGRTEGAIRILLAAPVLLMLVGILMIVFINGAKGALAAGGVCFVSVISIWTLFFVKAAGIGGAPGVGLWIFTVAGIVSGVGGIFLYRTETSFDEPERFKIGEEETERTEPYVQAKSCGKLTVLEGIYKGAQIPLEDMQTLMIGRDAEQSALVLEGVKISRKHCGITYCARTGGYLICDYSSNGTYYENGQRIPLHMKLEVPEGTKFYLGDKSNMLQVG